MRSPSFLYRSLYCGFNLATPLYTLIVASTALLRKATDAQEKTGLPQNGLGSFRCACTTRYSRRSDILWHSFVIT